MTSERGTLAAAVPLAGAIGLFGIVYGAGAGPLFGVGTTLATSALIFSGAVQFTVAGLALGGAAAPALLAAAALVNTRNLALGAVLRPHLTGGRLGRAGASWFVIDEVVGLALADRSRASRTLLVAGTLCYLTWLAGTAIGLLAGGVVADVEGLAAAVFPVLFVGLAAIAATTPSLVVRAVAAGAITVALALAVPELRSLAPVGAAVVAALPGPRHAAGATAAGADDPRNGVGVHMPGGARR